MIVVKHAVFILLLAIAGYYDIRKRIIPDWITIPGAILGIGLGLLKIELTLIQSISGAVAGSGFLLFLGLIFSRILKKEAIGGGDIKLCALIGSFIGFIKVFEIIFISSLIAVIWTVGAAIIKKWPLEKEIPYGFFLSICGILIAVVYLQMNY